MDNNRPSTNNNNPHSRPRPKRAQLPTLSTLHECNQYIRAAQKLVDDACAAIKAACAAQDEAALAKAQAAKKAAVSRKTHFVIHRSRLAAS